MAALALFWSVRDHLREGRGRVEAALRHAEGPAPLRAKALGGASWLAFRLGHYEQAELLAAESLAVYRSLGDESGIAGALNRLGAAASNQGDGARAISLQEHAFTTAHATGRQLTVAEAVASALHQAEARVSA